MVTVLLSWYERETRSSVEPMTFALVVGLVVAVVVVVAYGSLYSKNSFTQYSKLP